MQAFAPAYYTALYIASVREMSELREEREREGRGEKGKEWYVYIYVVPYHQFQRAMQTIESWQVGEQASKLGSIFQIQKKEKKALKTPDRRLIWPV